MLLQSRPARRDPFISRPPEKLRLRSWLWALLPATCGAAISYLLFQMARDPEIWAAWSNWFPHAVPPVFYDLRITQQHLHEAATGLDPLSDPESEFAYPRAVLWLRYLGLQHIPTEWLGFIQGVMLTIAVVLVLRPFTPRRAIGTAMLLFTPAIMLGFERANLDFALFLLCAACAWQWSRSTGLRKLGWPITAAVAAALLKLYPVFVMIGAALAETGRRRLLWLLSIVLVVSYWCFNSAEINLVMAKVPVSTSAAWGSLVFFRRLGRYLSTDPELFMWLGEVRWPLIGLVCYALGAVAAALVGVRLWERFSTIRLPRTEWAYYWIGAIICCGSFVGANYAYRWVFVLLTLPLLLRCVRAADPVVAMWARATLASVVISLAAPLTLEQGVFALVQAINWSCILLLIVGCTALRVTKKSPIFAFLLRLCARKRTEELVYSARSKSAGC